MSSEASKGKYKLKLRKKKLILPHAKKGKKTPLTPLRKVFTFENPQPYILCSFEIHINLF